MPEKSSRGIRLIAFARTIRWVGWGFGEPLLPIFIAMFAATYAGAGLIRSAYDLATLLALPVVGSLADKYPARTLILAALLLYPLVGAAYFLAGVTGFATFIVLARILNGAVWGLESVSVDTYYRRMALPKRLGSAFGFLSMLANFGWMIAALSGIWLVMLIPIHYLLLAIIPFSLVAYLVARLAPEDQLLRITVGSTVAVSYRTLFSRFTTWNSKLYTLGALVFFGEVLNVLSSFFLPLYVYQETGNPTQAILMAVVAAVPSLFGYHLGIFTDRTSERRVFSMGLLLLLSSLIVLFVFPELLIMLVAIFMIEVVLELIGLAQRKSVTNLSPASIWGERGSTMQGISVLGAIAGPVAIGIAFDIVGEKSTFLVLAAVAVALLALVLWVFATPKALT